MKTEFQQQTFSPESTVALGLRLGRVARPGDVIILSGELGAGKTQFAKGFAQGLGIKTPITSPTFNIMLCYESSAGLRLNHIDLYRLDEAAQLVDIDYFACLESEAVSVVEWGDKFADALPVDYLEVLLEYDEADVDSMHVDARVITVSPHGERAARLFEAWRSENASENCVPANCVPANRAPENRAAKTCVATENNEATL